MPLQNMPFVETNNYYDPHALVKAQPQNRARAALRKTWMLNKARFYYDLEAPPYVLHTCTFGS